MSDDLILRRMIGDVEARRLYREHPSVRASYEEYCPTCNKRGSYTWKGVEVECDCRAQLHLHKHYLVSGIGVNYQRLSWDDYEGDEELRGFADKYLERHEAFVTGGIGLLLHGTNGVGKTFSVTMLLKDLVKLGYSCYSTTFSSMVEMFTAGWKDVEDRRHFERKVVQSDVLVLDDMGKELKTKTNLSESTFDDVLRRRVNNGRPTFLTTNQTLAELSEGYGKSILSLLKERSIKYKVEGADFRPRSNERTMGEVMRGETRPIV